MRLKVSSTPFVYGIGPVLCLFLTVACGKSNDVTPPIPDGGSSCEDNPNNGAPELCDNIDNDCDGEVDEYADMLCGGDCASTPNLNCSASSYPPAGTGWAGPTNDNSSGGIVLDDDGALTITQSSRRFLHVWVANTDDGTVSKLDAETGNELARYPSVIDPTLPGHAHTAPSWNNPCVTNDASNTGNCPSRTAVDQHGNAYVANRAFGKQGTVTKFAEYGNDQDKLARCDDRNSDGVIRTSHDADGDGKIDPADPAEFPLAATDNAQKDDECVLWTKNVGAVAGRPRALAVGLNRDGAPGLVWVGLHLGQKVLALHPEDGSIAKRADNTPIDIATPGFNPYGAVTARDGKIWFTRTANNVSLGYVTDTATSITLAPANPDGGHAYGITADREGNLYTGSQDSGTGIAYRYNPSTQVWTTIAPVPGHYGTARGVATDRESLWVAMSSTDRNFAGVGAKSVIQYRLSDLSLTKHWEDIKCLGPIGVGISFNNFVWAVCFSDDKAAFLDPTSGQWQTHAVGHNPYTYSDFTGYNLNYVAENGTYAFVAEGCENDSESTRWEGFVIAKGEIPSDTAVTIRVRVASTKEALSAQPYSERIEVTQIEQAIAFDPTLNGKFLQMEVALSTENPDIVPKVKGIDLIKTCTVEIP
ncbi:MAG: hypothetical protein H6714_05915 [Myxococcales bacterium]|nr:hypothetical protein [Myxococcales bacterium]